MKFVLCTLLLVAAMVQQDGAREINKGDFENAYKMTGSLSRDPEFFDQGAVHFNHALAALDVGELTESRIALELSCAWGGENFEPLRTFLLGNIAFAQCLKMEKLTERVEAGLPAHDSAIGSANLAVDHWIAALNDRDPWPEAVRNIERAQRKLQKLLRARATFIEKSKKKSGSQERQASEKKNNKNRNKTKSFEESTPSALDELAEGELKVLLLRLEKKEKEKRLKRMQRRLQQSGISGERDW